MDEETTSKTGGLSPEYKTYERQKCFVAHSHGARWCDDVVNVCNQVLPGFGLEPWYAADHFDPTKPLRDKVVELIANTRYGIYDLSYWRKDDKSEWHMPRNVLIELGVAIALNRPTLLLRHVENRISGLQLPTCLESVSANILEFSGGKTLQLILKEHLSRWAHTPPEHDWWNRYCMFGNRICEYREAYPHGQQWGQETIRCHILDGQDADRLDFRGVVEEVLGRFSDVTFGYLDALPMADGYDFLLCTHCQAVRSTPFAIYRITPQTPAETFLAIGMSLALETQFTHRIPKILLTTNKHDIPSLLSGYEVVEARNDQECKTYLRKFMPDVIREVRKTTWRPRPLPFIEVVPKHVEKPAAESKTGTDAQSRLHLIAADKTDTGKQPEQNEDSAYKRIESSEEGDLGLFIVADGMGGYQAGEVASNFAVQKISEGLRNFFVPIYEQPTVRLTPEELGETTVKSKPTKGGKSQKTRKFSEIAVSLNIENQLVEAIKEAHKAILRYEEQHSGSRGLGCTVTTALINNDKAYIANVGNSRTYLLRNGELISLTKDHSLVAKLVEAKQIEPEDVYSHPQRNLIYRSLGAGHKNVEVDVYHLDLLFGDTLLLCSDGLWEMVWHEDLKKVLSAPTSPQKICDTLIDLANDNGGEDNITAVVVHVSAYQK